MSAPLIFQIGPNKCGTTSLYRLFAESGVPSVKFSGLKNCLVSDGVAMRQNAQVTISENLAKGREPLYGLMMYAAFFDMEYTTGHRQIENYREFRTLYEHYPHAKFLLNYRDRLDWLRSRSKHSQGRYIKRASRRLGCSGVEVLGQWLSDFDEHLDDVRTFFADKPGSLLEFDIDNDPVEKLIEFASPEFDLDASHWSVCNVSKDVTDLINRNFMETLFDVPLAPPPDKEDRVEGRVLQ